MFFSSALFVAALGEKLILSPTEFDNVVFHSGKGAFIKFFSSKCDLCEKMASDWHEIAKKWNNKELVTIISVDCASEMRSVCTKYGIKTHPTLKYYAGSEEGKLKDYKGSRSIESLDLFIRSTFKPICDILTHAGCLPEEVAVLEWYARLPNQDLVSIQEGYEVHQKEFYKLIGEEAKRELEFQKRRKEMGKKDAVFNKLITLAQKKKKQEDEDEDEDEVEL